jgi:hypothetical protein
MTKLHNPLWMLFVCSALPLSAAPADPLEPTLPTQSTVTDRAPASSPSRSYTWQEILDGSALVEIENATAKDHKLDISLSEFGFLSAKGDELSNEAVGLPKIDEKEVALAPGRVRRYRLKSVKPATVIWPGTYTALVAVRADTKTLTAWRISITVPGIQPIPTDVEASATRSCPFTSKWNVDFSLPLAAAIQSDQTGLKSGLPLGLLKRDSGAGYAVVFWNTPTGGQSSAFLSLTVSGIRQAGRYKGVLSFPNGKTTTISVFASDHIVYPMLVLFLGIVTGGLVKKWINVGRALRIFQRDIATLSLTFSGRADEFRQATTGKPYHDFDIADDFGKRTKELSGRIGPLRLSVTPLDKTNTDYQKALSDLQTLQTVADSWPVFASDLRMFEQALDTIDSRHLTPPLGNAGEQLAVLANRTLLNGKTMTLASYSTTRSTIQSAASVATKWLSLLQRKESLGDLYQDLWPVVPANSADRTLLQTVDPAHAFALLWAANDAGALARVESMLDRIETTLEALRTTYQRPTIQPPAEAPAMLLEVKPGGAKDEQRRQKLEFSVQLGDWLAFWIAVVAGVLTGLTTYYFGKPFGSFADYATLFLWGLGSKFVVDIASLGLDKATQAVTRQKAADAG